MLHPPIPTRSSFTYRVTPPPVVPFGASAANSIRSVILVDLSPVRHGTAHGPSHGSGELRASDWYTLLTTLPGTPTGVASYDGRLATVCIPDPSPSVKHALQIPALTGTRAGPVDTSS